MYKLYNMPGSVNNLRKPVTNISGKKSNVSNQTSTKNNKKAVTNHNNQKKKKNHIKDGPLTLDELKQLYSWQHPPKISRQGKQEKKDFNLKKAHGRIEEYDHDPYKHNDQNTLVKYISGTNKSKALNQIKEKYHLVWNETGQDYELFPILSDKTIDNLAFVFYHYFFSKAGENVKFNCMKKGSEYNFTVKGFITALSNSKYLNPQEYNDQILFQQIEPPVKFNNNS